MCFNEQHSLLTRKLQTAPWTKIPKVHFSIRHLSCCVHHCKCYPLWKHNKTLNIFKHKPNGSLNYTETYEFMLMYSISFKENFSMDKTTSTTSISSNTATWEDSFSVFKCESIRSQTFDLCLPHPCVRIWKTKQEMEQTNGQNTWCKIISTKWHQSEQGVWLMHWIFFWRAKYVEANSCVIMKMSFWILFW